MGMQFLFVERRDAEAEYTTINGGEDLEMVDELLFARRWRRSALLTLDPASRRKRCWICNIA